jgi:hypothetical protein
MPRDLSKFIAPDLGDSKCTECSKVAAEFIWAREVWEAYSSQNELDRNWIKSAIGE